MVLAMKGNPLLVYECRREYDESVKRCMTEKKSQIG